MVTYELQILTKGGDITDIMEFDTREEAEKEKLFYKSFYGNDYKYEIVVNKKFTIYFKKTY